MRPNQLLVFATGMILMITPCAAQPKIMFVKCKCSTNTEKELSAKIKDCQGLESAYDRIHSYFIESKGDYFELKCIGGCQPPFIIEFPLRKGKLVPRDKDRMSTSSIKTGRPVTIDLIAVTDKDVSGKGLVNHVFLERLKDVIYEKTRARMNIIETDGRVEKNIYKCDNLKDGYEKGVTADTTHGARYAIFSNLTAILHPGITRPDPNGSGGGGELVETADYIWRVSVVDACSGSVIRNSSYSLNENGRLFSRNLGESYTDASKPADPFPMKKKFYDRVANDVLRQIWPDLHAATAHSVIFHIPQETAANRKWRTALQHVPSLSDFEYTSEGVLKAESSWNMQRLKNWLRASGIGKKYSISSRHGNQIIIKKTRQH